MLVRSVADVAVDLADVAVPTAGAIDAVLPDDPSAGVPVTDVADAVVTAPGEVDHAPEITDPAPADVATTDAAPAAEAPTTNTDTPEEAN